MYRKIAPILFAVVLLAVCLVILQPALTRGFTYIQQTRQLLTPNDGLEGTLLHEAQLIKRGEALYRPIVPEEFVSAPYTPLHAIVLAALPFEQNQPFNSGRWISILAYLAVGVLLGSNVAMHSRQRWLGILAAAFWLAFPPAQLWSTRIKPDLLALVFTSGGLLLASLRRGRWADWAAVVFALAFLTKQTALIAPFAVGLNLLISDWRRALRYGLIYGLAIGLPYFALDLVTHRQATAHIWGLHRSEWWDFALFWKYVRLLGWSLPLLGLTLLAAGATRHHHGYRQAFVYALLAPMTLYAAGEVGAHHNHLFETMSAWIVAGGIGAGIVLNRPTPSFIQKGGVVLTVLALISQAWLLRATPAWYRGEYTPLDLERYVRYIQSKNGDVLLDNPGLAIAANKALTFDDPSTMGPAISSGVWNPTAMHDGIRSKRFSLILLKIDPASDTVDPSQRWTSETLQLINQHYQREFKDTLFAYVPKP